jgi:hypothetical protein
MSRFARMISHTHFLLSVDSKRPCASYAALGRTAEAKAALSDELARHPDLTIEGITGTEGWSNSERKWMMERMRTADFPICSSAETLAKNPKPSTRMPVEMSC